MSRTALILMAALLALSACGIRRPLMRPSDIPEYEQKRAEHMKQYEEQPTTPDTDSSTSQ